VATLFAIITVALVASFGAAGGSLSDLGEGEEAFALEVAGGDAGTGEGTQPSTSPSTAPPTSADAEVAGPEISPSEALGALSNGIGYEERVLSSPPPEPTSSTSGTEPPTTAEPTTTAAPDTTAADSSSSETTAPADSSSSTDTSTAGTDTTAPGGETTTTAHPDGWVDTGYGVFVPPVLLSIRYCESRDNYTAANPSSSARGAYQFTSGSWDAYGHADRYGVSQAHLATPAQQDEAALLTWQQAGTTPWNASKSCWS
jgi:hypothetical protein